MQLGEGDMVGGSPGSSRMVHKDEEIVKKYKSRLRLKWTHTLSLFLAVCGLFSQSVPLALPLLCVVIGYIVVFYGDFWYRSYLTLNRDLSGLALILDIKYDLWRRLSENKGLHEIWEGIVKKYGSKTAMVDIESGRQYTFKQFDEQCNRYANFYQSLGLRSGDVVALYMENCTDFVAAWMGAAKIGVITAWINSNLKKEPLAHCVKTSKAQAIITTKTLQDGLGDAMSSNLLPFDQSSVYVLGTPNVEGFKDLEKVLTKTKGNEPKKMDKVDFSSILCFIYTSGTTGLPKAAVMKHYRYYSMVSGAARSFGVHPTDKIYVSMPIYHTAAGILGVGQCLMRGSCCVIRKKFSASNFWKDCCKYECTASQYIGEICRYLLAQPECPEEKMHEMRMMYGNGLRAEIWQPFVDRFGVKIGEVYGSTEGTSNLVNIDGHVGACGFLPISPLTKKMHPVRLIKVDDITGEVLRGNNGLCIACKPGQTGAMVSTIRPNNPLLRFEGYLNSSETSKKIIKNVFAPGDSCFVSGDLLHWDRLGYVYFKDRTGDTFRWKGENVSTTEVEAIIHPLRGVADATVYGVQIKGHEGRAGMASVVRAEGYGGSDMRFLDGLAEKMTSSLPQYAVPLFIRLCPHVDKTGTFKLVKTNLQRLGYSRDISDHQVYIFNSKLQNYSLLSDEQYQQLEDGVCNL